MYVCVCDCVYMCVGVGECMYICMFVTMHVWGSIDIHNYSRRRKKIGQNVREI